MKKALVIGVTSLAAAACLTQAAVSATATVQARVSFTQPAGINVGNQLTLPTVSVAPVTTPASLGGGFATGGASTQTVTSGPTGNAQLTIRGQPGDVVSTTVPESFTVVRSGGEETLTVKTNTNAEYAIGSGEVVLGGAILNSDTMSVDIGGSLSLASARDLVPGPYEGLLVVVVQYN